jgi:hypothetical protein
MEKEVTMDNQNIKEQVTISTGRASVPPPLTGSEDSPDERRDGSESQSPRKRPVQPVLLAGGALIGLGAVLPQGKAPIVGSISLGTPTTIFYLLVAAVVIVNAMGKKLGWPVVLGGIALFQGVWALFKVMSTASQCRSEMADTGGLFAEGFSALCDTIQPGTGAYAMLVGGVTVIVGVWLNRRKKSGGQSGEVKHQH